MNKDKVYLNGVEIDTKIKPFTTNEFNYKFLPKIVYCAGGISAKSKFRILTGGKLVCRDYNFIVLCLGEDDKESYDYILDLFLKEVFDQLKYTIRTTGFRYIFNTDDGDLIDYGIKQLFQVKWDKMFKNDSFYKDCKYMRITFAEIDNYINKSISKHYQDKYNV